MQNWWGSVAVAALLMASGAYADTATGVLTYDQAFFADSRPSTAYDMIKRLPGFTFDIGDSARGFAGTAGNVLIDGQRPTSKTDTLDSIISRIPASDVDHIDIIRGGAPGIDMQGRTVMANIIRKKTSSTTIVADISDNIFLDVHTVPNASLQLTSHVGDSTYEASASRYGSLDDSVGIGRRVITDSLGNLLQPVDRENRRAVGYGYGFTGAMISLCGVDVSNPTSFIRARRSAPTLPSPRPAIFRTSLAERAARAANSARTGTAKFRILMSKRWHLSGWAGTRISTSSPMARHPRQRTNASSRPTRPASPSYEARHGIKRHRPSRSKAVAKLPIIICKARAATRMEAYPSPFPMRMSP